MSHGIVQDKADLVKEPVGSKEGGLKEAALKAIGKGGKPTRFASGVIQKVGFSFFQDKKPKTVYANDLMSPEAIGQALISQGVLEFEPTYSAEIEFGGGKREVKLSSFHTRRLAGVVPRVSVGDAVDVWVMPTTGGVGWGFMPAKKV